MKSAVCTHMGISLVDGMHGVGFGVGFACIVFTTSSLSLRIYTGEVGYGSNNRDLSFRHTSRR